MHVAGDGSLCVWIHVEEKKSQRASLPRFDRTPDRFYDDNRQEDEREEHDRRGQGNPHPAHLDGELVCCAIVNGPG